MQSGACMPASQPASQARTPIQALRCADRCFAVQPIQPIQPAFHLVFVGETPPIWSLSPCYRYNHCTYFIVIIRVYYCYCACDIC